MEGKGLQEERAIIRAKPASHTPRRNAWVMSESLRVSSSLASSTPMRWSTLVNAFDSAAATAKK